MAMRIMMPEKIFSMLLLVKNKLPQPENPVKQKIKPAKFIGSFLEKLQSIARNEGAGHGPLAPLHFSPSRREVG